MWQYIKQQTSHCMRHHLANAPCSTLSQSTALCALNPQCRVLLLLLLLPVAHANPRQLQRSPTTPGGWDGVPPLPHSHDCDVFDSEATTLHSLYLHRCLLALQCISLLLLFGTATNPRGTSNSESSQHMVNGGAAVYTVTRTRAVVAAARALSACFPPASLPAVAELWIESSSQTHAPARVM